MTFYPKRPFNDLPALPPAGDIETKTVLKACIEARAALAELRLVSRQTLALLCGHPSTVDSFARRLYMAGLPRSQMLADVFLTRA